MHAGSKCLSIFTHAFNARALRAYADGPLTIGELEQMFGWAPQSSLRATVRNMSELGVLTDSEPGTSAKKSKELTHAGQALLPLADSIDAWLQEAPGDPIQLDSDAARGIMRVLAASWDATIIQAVAEAPQTLADLSARGTNFSYPSLKRRLAKLRSAGLLLPVQTDFGTSYGAGEWLCQAARIFMAAVRWEREYDAEAPPPVQEDARAILLLALPQIKLSPEISGTCTLAMYLPDGAEEPKHELAGIAIEIKNGAIVSRDRARGELNGTHVAGTVEAWSVAMATGRPDALRIPDSKQRFARSLAVALTRIPKGKDRMNLPLR